MRRQAVARQIIAILKLGSQMDKTIAWRVPLYTKAWHLLPTTCKKSIDVLPMSYLSQQATGCIVAVVVVVIVVVIAVSRASNQDGSNSSSEEMYCHTLYRLVTNF